MSFGKKIGEEIVKHPDLGVDVRKIKCANGAMYVATLSDGKSYVASFVDIPDQGAMDTMAMEALSRKEEELEGL